MQIYTNSIFVSESAGNNFNILSLLNIQTILK